MTSIQTSRTALRLGSAGFVLAVGLLSAPASAQDPTASPAVTPVPAPTATAQGLAAAEEETGETIIVTGSRIARPDLDTASPIAILGAEEFALSGAVNVEDVLNDLPQLYPALTASSNNPGDGSATADLRGLGASRTLVLVNSRRYVSADTTQLVDLNTIPVGLIKRVDVLTGGRGAVYGSDAIAGVINFVLDDEFEGAKVNADYRITEEGDGGTFNTYGIIGGNFAGGRGNATVYVDYLKRKAIFQGDRPFSARTISEDGEGGTFFGGSGSVPGTRFQAGRIPTGVIPGLNPGSNRLFEQDGSFRVYNGATDSFNYAPDNYLQVPQERFLIYGAGKYEINDNVELYTETTFINNRVDTQLASTPITGNFRVPVNSPFFSASTRTAFTQADVLQTGAITTNGLADIPNDGFITLSIGRRLNEVGPRVSQNDRNAYRILVGARGEITGDFRYDGYYSYARTKRSETQQGNVSRSRFAQALNTVGTTTGTVACANPASGCAPVNIFGPGNISPGGAAFITINTSNSTTVEEEVANFSINNANLFDFGLGADPIGIAVGVEWRRSFGSFQPDFSLSSGDVVGFNAGTPTVGQYSTTDIFGELVVPIIADRPFFHRLELNGAARYSNYSNQVGNAFAWSAGAQWAPIEDITLRGQFQRAVRAPTIEALFLGQSEGFPGFVDYCRLPAAATNASLRASCLNNGVPANLVGTPFGSGNAQIRAIFGGNPDLREEKSDTYTVGAILQPRFLPGLSIAADYYNIEIADAILAAGPGATNVRDACFGNPDNGFTPFDTSFCSLIPRDPTSAEIDGLLNTNLNAGFFKTSGVDVSLKYQSTLGFGLFGTEETRFSLRADVNRVINVDFNTLAAIPDLNISCEGRYGSFCGNPYSKWRGSARATFSTGPAAFSLSYRYVGKASDDEQSGTVSVTSVKAQSYFDASINFEVLKGFSLNFGVDNFTNNKPPLIGDLNSEQANTYPSTYDVYGRRYFFGATATF